MTYSGVFNHLVNTQPVSTIARQFYLEVADGYDALDNAILEVVRAVGPSRPRAEEVMKHLGHLADQLHDACQRLGFTFRAVSVASVQPQALTNEPDEMKRESSHRRLLSSMPSARRSKAHELLATAIAGGETAVDTGENDPVEAESPRALLETLPDVKSIPHVAEKLKLKYAHVEKVPRGGSRGNAVLYVLSTFGRTRSLSLDDLVVAFRAMRIIDESSSSPDARRVASWEVNELIRRRWPIVRVPGEGFRFDPEGAMT